MDTSLYFCAAGKLVNNKISWRGDSALGDGKEENLDLTKGMYDAGDLMKFGFPMAFTATILSWAILEYGDHMKQAKELDHIQESLKWITDYLINAHPSGNVLYIQVSTYLLYFKIELIDALVNELPVVEKYLKILMLLLGTLRLFLSAQVKFPLLAFQVNKSERALSILEIFFKKICSTHYLLSI